ncbi:MAG TPA: hypothetical protein VFZ61_05175 [Polyangiales bacterium]
MSLFHSKRATLRSRQVASGARMLTCGFLLHGCQSDLAGPDLGGPDGVGPQDGRSGQTGSPQSGGVECYEDQECEASAEARAASLRAPNSLVRSFVGAKCEQLSLIAGEESRSGPACYCELGDGGSLLIGPAGGDCQLRGRSGTCVWDSFDGCDRFDAHSCDATCTDLEQRLAADAARTFDASPLYADCEKNSCRSVLSIDGRCTPGDALGSGKTYDCELGGPAILDAYTRERAAEMQADAAPLSWPRVGAYADGTRGWVELGVTSESWAGSEATPHVYAWAQFADTRGSAQYSGEVLDPLEGTDDCGVIRKGMWGSSEQSFFQVGSAALELHGQRHPFSAPDNALSYSPDESFAALSPPYGVSARFQAQGGGLREPIDVPVRVPVALHVESMAGVTRIDNEALSLRWSGKGDAPLRVVVQLTPQLADILFFTELECLLKDDGEFEIPASVMAKLPQGIATVSFTREARTVESSGGQNFLSVGRVQSLHHLAVGERCERQDVLDACKRFAAHQQAVFDQCGTAGAPPTETTCPAYLAESCVGCPEYYECSSKALRCENGSPTYYSGCSCPAP